MIVLGIETSCDDTSVAVIEDRSVRANVVAAQEIHREFGGVVPELASREHLEFIEKVFRAAIRDAQIELNDIDLISVTYGPGLAGALLIGVSFARGLGRQIGIPIMPVHHMEGHIASTYLESDWEPPFIALLASGGHTQLVRVDGPLQFEVIGSTIDDAVGEAFDKTAKLIDLGYPGGPVIDSLAAQGDPQAVDFPTPYVQNKHLDFSFSGLKTAVVNHRKRYPETRPADIAASFQRVAVGALMIKIKRAIQQTGLKRVTIAGGVSANSELRRRLSELTDDGVEMHLPKLQFCTDNGAMIAMAGLNRYLHQPQLADQPIRMIPTQSLNEVSVHAV